MGWDHGYDAVLAAKAGASIGDNVTFDIAGANANTETPIEIEYKVDGTLSTTRNSNYASATVSYQFGIGGSPLHRSLAFTFDGSSLPSTVALFPTLPFGPPVTYVSADYIDSDPLHLDVIATYNLQGADLSTDFYMGLGAECPDGVSCDLTGTVRFILPSDVDMITQSGENLTRGAVPEPSTWAMFLMGLAGLGYAGYRKAKSPRTALTV